MGTLFASTVLGTLRAPVYLFWVIAFPLIMGSIFSFMFSDIGEFYRVQAVPVAVVEDAALAERPAFRAFLDAASEGDEAALDVTYVASESDALALAEEGTAAAYVRLSADGVPEMVVPTYEDSRSQLERSVIRTLLDAYLQRQAVSELLVRAAADGVAVDAARAAEAFSGAMVATEEADVLRVDADGYSRYYYALLAMTILMTASMALYAVAQARANCTPIGARCQVSALSPGRQLITVVGASWICAFACIAVAFAFLRIALDVEFGGRDGLALGACAVCALTATALGSFIGAVPRISTDAKTGVCVAVASVGALTAGLYGEFAMQFADYLSEHFPWIQAVNPAAQIAEAFYALAYYDSLSPFATALAALAAMAAVLFLASAALMRRQRYAGL